MYVAMAYVNDEVTPVQAVIDRLVRQGSAYYVAMPLSEEQQERVRQRMPVLVTVRAFYFEAEPTLIAEACEAEGLRAFYADWDVESAFEGLLSRYGVQLTSQAFETLGRALQQAGMSAADFGRAANAFSQGFKHPAWIKEGAWVQDKQTQCRGRIEIVREHDVTIYGHLDDDPLGRPPLITRISKDTLPDVFEPCEEPGPRYSRWALID